MNNFDDLFLQAREISDLAARAAFLDEACAHQPELRARLDALLADASAADAYFGEADTVERASKLVPQAATNSEVRVTPTHIGPYRILERIGHGGMGDVFRAVQKEPIRREVALKLIKLGMDTQQVIARFEAERQALALMDHPHIARVLDAGADDLGHPYFVMELVRGVPITQYADEKQLTLRERLSLMQQVCQAIQHAHSKGVIHRDLKPSNILVSTQDGRPHAKVIDFGIAKATAQPLTEKTLFTQFQQFIGTPQYMSPEQAEGSLDIDTRSDVYALGILLYELLTGGTPVEAATLRQAALHEIARIIKEQDTPKPSTRLLAVKPTSKLVLPDKPEGTNVDIRSTKATTLASLAKARSISAEALIKTVRGELDWLVMKALEKDRARRYETPNQLSDDIARYLEGQPIVAAPPSSTYRIKKFIRKHRAPVLAAAAVLTLMTAGILGTSWGLVREKAAKEEANQQAKIAGQAQKEAETLRGKSEARAIDLQYQSYRLTLDAARNAAEAGQTLSALKYLNSCPTEMRGIEWREVQAFADDAIGAVEIPKDTRIIAIAPDGTHAILRRQEVKPGHFELWRATDGVIVAQIELPDVLETLDADIANGGSKLAFLVLNKKEPMWERKVTIHVWDLAQQRITWSRPSCLKDTKDLFIYSENTEDVFSLSANGTRVLVKAKTRRDEYHQSDFMSADNDSGFKGLNSWNGTYVFEVNGSMEGYMSDIKGEKLSPDGSFMICDARTVGDDTRLLAIKTPNEPKEVFKELRHLDFTPDTESFLVVNSKGERELVSGAKFDQREKIEVGDKNLTAYLPSSRLALGIKNNSLRLWFNERRATELWMNGIRGEFSSLHLDVLGKAIFVYSASHVTKFWLPSRTVIERMTALNSSGINLSRSGKDVFERWENGHWTYRNSGDGSLIAILPHHPKSNEMSSTVDFYDPKSQSLGRVLNDEFTLYRIENNRAKEVCHWKLSTALGSAAANLEKMNFEDGGQLLHVRCRNRKTGERRTFLINAVSGQLVREVPSGFWIVKVKGEFVWGGKEDEFMKLSLKTWKEELALPRIKVKRLSFSDDESRLAVWDGKKISIYHLPKLELTCSFTPPEPPDTGLMWADNDCRLIGGNSSEVMWFDPTNGRLLASKTRKAVDAARFQIPFGETLKQWVPRMAGIDQMESAPDLATEAAKRWVAIKASGAIAKAVEEAVQKKRQSYEIQGKMKVTVEQAIYALDVPELVKWAIFRHKITEDEKLEVRAGEEVSKMGSLLPTQVRKLIAEKLADVELREAVKAKITWGDSEDEKLIEHPWNVLRSLIQDQQPLLKLLKVYGQCCELVPEHTESWIIAGAAAYRLGQHDLGLQFLTQAPSLRDIRLAPEWGMQTSGFAWLAMCHHHMGHHDAALKALRSAVWRMSFYDDERELQKMAANMIYHPALDELRLPHSPEYLAIHDAFDAHDPFILPAQDTRSVREMMRWAEYHDDPNMKGGFVRVKGRVVKAAPFGSVLGFNLFLESVARGVHVTVKFDSTSGFSLADVARLEGREIIVTGDLKVNSPEGDIWGRERCLDMTISTPDDIQVLNPEAELKVWWNGYLKPPFRHWSKVSAANQDPKP